MKIQEKMYFEYYLNMKNVLIYSITIQDRCGVIKTFEGKTPRVVSNVLWKTRVSFLKIFPDNSWLTIKKTYSVYRISKYIIPVVATRGGASVILFRRRHGSFNHLWEKLQFPEQHIGRHSNRFDFRHLMCHYFQYDRLWSSQQHCV